MFYPYGIEYIALSDAPVQSLPLSRACEVRLAQPFGRVLSALADPSPYTHLHRSRSVSRQEHRITNAIMSDGRARHPPVEALTTPPATPPSPICSAAPGPAPSPRPRMGNRPLPRMKMRHPRASARDSRRPRPPVGAAPLAAVLLAAAHPAQGAGAEAEVLVGKSPPERRGPGGQRRRG